MKRFHLYIMITDIPTELLSRFCPTPHDSVALSLTCKTMRGRVGRYFDTADMVGAYFGVYSDHYRYRSYWHTVFDGPDSDLEYLVYCGGEVHTYYNDVRWAALVAPDCSVYVHIGEYGGSGSRRARDLRPSAVAPYIIIWDTAYNSVYKTVARKSNLHKLSDRVQVYRKLRPIKNWQRQ